MSLPCRPKPAVDTLSSDNAVAVMSGCRLGHFPGQWCRERAFICLLADIIKQRFFILVLIHNLIMSGCFVILCTPLCSLRMWLFRCPVKLQLRFPDVSVVSVLIHSYIILILILEPYANKEIQRRDLSCTFCNPQYLLKSLLFLRGWLMPTCLMFKRMCRLCARPGLRWQPGSLREEVGHQQLWSS